MPLEESDDLSTLVFGGPETCSPCFGDGKTGLPFRRDGGPLTQGMAGQPRPRALRLNRTATSGRRLSADGTHLIFGSASAFEGDAATSGDVSIYDRNLLTGVTHVVSKTPAGANLPCLQGAGNCHAPGDADGIGARSTSPTTARAIVVAQRVTTDAAGNRYWHPYMNIDDSTSTRRSGSRRNQRRALRRDDRGRLLGALHDRRSADGRRPRQQRRHLPRGRLGRRRSHRHAGLDRLRRRRHRRLRPGRRPPAATTGTPSAPLPPTAAARSPSPAESGVARGSGAIYFLSPEKLDGLGVAQPAEPLPAAPGEAARLRRHPGGLERGDHGRCRGQRRPRLRRFPGHAERRVRRLLLGTAADRLPHLRPHGDLSLRRRGPTSSLCASCPTTGAALTADTRLSRYRAKPRRRRPRLLHLGRTARAARHRRALRTCTSGRTGGFS